MSSNTYARVWQQARRRALTKAQAAFQLAGRPYDLRHAAVSLWLNAGVPATQVAERPGHSVDVLLKIYVKCMDGQDDAAKRQIEAALRELSVEQEAELPAAAWRGYCQSTPDDGARLNGAPSCGSHKT